MRTVRGDLEMEHDPRPPVPAQVPQKREKEGKTVVWVEEV